MPRDPFARLIAFAPLVFLAHFAEEVPEFVDWFNAHVSFPMTTQSFWRVNLGVLAVTILVAAFAWLDDSPLSAGVAIGWLSFVMGANAVVHISATIADRGYTPGVITALVLYLPYFALALSRAYRRGVNVAALSAVAIASAVPMLVQGYRVLVLGSRLF